jgi:hypothetical protein
VLEFTSFPPLRKVLRENFRFYLVSRFSAHCAEEHVLELVRKYQRVLREVAGIERELFVTALCKASGELSAFRFDGALHRVELNVVDSKLQFTYLSCKASIDVKVARKHAEQELNQIAKSDFVQATVAGLVLFYSDAESDRLIEFNAPGKSAFPANSRTGQLSSGRFLLLRSAFDCPDIPETAPQFYDPTPFDSNAEYITTTLNAQVLICFEKNDDSRELIKRALEQQLNAMLQVLIQLPECSPTALLFQPRGFAHPITIVYPLKQARNEDYLMRMRQAYHARLCLPLDRPMLRLESSLDLQKILDGAAAPQAYDAGAGVGPHGHLLDVHTTIAESSKLSGTLHLVNGSYEYRHYMNDGFNDNGWGCAYRSMQTICSWLLIQNYTAKAVPSHREIQTCLVQLGDKPSSFVGSSQWIGAIEIQQCLAQFYNLSCRILNVRSGADLANHASELARHFDTEGTPVMIGGGVLAYTLLGIDWNSNTGDVRFLILDPHYTGADKLQSILAKGWCGWKGKELFKKDAFYNCCMPLRPREL